VSVIAGSFWASSVGLFLVLAFAFCAVFLVAWMLLGTRARTRRQKKLARRFGRTPGPVPGTETAGTAQAQWVPAGLAEAGTRIGEAIGFSAGLDDRLERAGLPIHAGEFVALTAIAGVAGAIFAGILLQNIIFVLLVAAAAALIPWVWMVRSLSKRQQKMMDQLADTLSILASSLRAGYSFLQALDTVSKEIGEPSASEFSRVVAEIRLGRPIDESLMAMAERVGSRDLKWAVIAVNIQRQVGGNLAEVLDIVASTVRERGYVHRQIRVLSAEGRLSMYILAALPFLIGIYEAIVNPAYLRLLFTTSVGILLLIVGGALMAVGLFWMTRIVKIDV